MSYTPTVTKPLYPIGKTVYNEPPVLDAATPAVHIYPAFLEPTAGGITTIKKLDATHILVKGTSGGKASMNVWDVSNPAAAVRVGQCLSDTNSGWRDKFAVVGNFALVLDSGTNRQMHCIDCSDRTNPRIVARYGNSLGSGLETMFSGAECVAVRADGIGVIVGSQFPAVLGVFDASALPGITYIGMFQNTTYDSGAYAGFFGNRMLITTFDAIMATVDMSNPAAPSILLTSGTSNSTEYFSIRQDGVYAYMSINNNSNNQRFMRVQLSNLATLQISNPLAADRLYQFEYEQRNGIDYIYTTTLKTGGCWLARWNVTGSGTPTLVDVYSSPRIGTRACCAFGGGLVFTGSATPLDIPGAFNANYFAGVQYA